MQDSERQQLVKELTQVIEDLDKSSTAVDDETTAALINAARVEQKLGAVH